MVTSKTRRIVRAVVVIIGILTAVAYLGRPLAIRELERREYLEELAVFRDPKMTDLREWPGREAYRFLWVGAWGNRMVITALVHGNGGGMLHMKVADCNDPPKILTETTIDLNADHIQGLRHRVDSNKFWKTRVPRELMPDGADWWLEAKLPTGHHLGVERSPQQGSFVNIGRHLLELSGSDWGRWILPRS